MGRLERVLSWTALIIILLLSVAVVASDVFIELSGIRREEYGFALLFLFLILNILMFVKLRLDEEKD